MLKKLSIFDFDETLITSESKIEVLHKDGSKTEMDAHKFVVYKLKEGDTVDFEEFERKIVKPRPIGKIINIFLNDYKRHDVIILSARQIPDLIKKVLKQFSLPDVEVITVGGTNPILKKDQIEKKIIQNGYNSIDFYDDSPRNISAAKELKQKYPEIRLKTILVIKE